MLLASMGATAFNFHRCSSMAGVLMMPYIIWTWVGVALVNYFLHTAQVSKQI